MSNFPAVLLAFCSGFAAYGGPPAGEKPRPTASIVHFKTAGGCLLEAAYRAPSSGGLVFVNTHGLGSNREEWRVLERKVSAKGHGYLSLDLRGHGKSAECAGKKLDYHAFSSAQWGELSADIAAAAGFLKTRKIPENRLILCGASIGANLSLKAAAEGVKPAALLLLSPGLSYAGVEADPLFKRLGRVPVLIAASRNDPYAWKSAELLADGYKYAVPVGFAAGAGGHGAGMLSEDRPELLKRILDWAELIAAPKPLPVPSCEPENAKQIRH